MTLRMLCPGFVLPVQEKHSKLGDNLAEHHQDQQCTKAAVLNFCVHRKKMKTN